MLRDPIIEELRHIRQAIEERCHHDPETYYRHLLEIQQEYRDRLVQRQPKPALILRDKRRVTSISGIARLPIAH